jgi:respiratory burst oxidase
MYISVPLVLYVGERMLRALRSNAYTVKILKVSTTGGNCNGKFMQLASVNLF